MFSERRLLQLMFSVIFVQPRKHFHFPITLTIVVSCSIICEHSLKYTLRSGLMLTSFCLVSSWRVMRCPPNGHLPFKSWVRSGIPMAPKARARFVSSRSDGMQMYIVKGRRLRSSVRRRQVAGVLYQSRRGCLSFSQGRPDLLPSLHDRLQQ